FELPEFPVHLRNKMVSIQKGQVSDDLRKKIIDTLFCALCFRTLYPHQLYEEAAMALVKRYPRLGDASALGYKTWQASLRYKGKNVRRRLPPGNVEVDMAREESRIQKERRSLEAAAEREERTDEMTGAAIAKRRVCKPYFGVGEDEYSINGHIAYMVVETKKALWDREKILNEFERRTDKSAEEGLRRKRRGERPHPHLRSRRTPASTCKREKQLLHQEAGTRRAAYSPYRLFSGEDAVSSASMQVAVEGLTVDVADVVEGVSLMMAMYWAFDIEYRPSARNTLVILERAMGVKETTITMTALKVIGNL
ncbi:uncharacterized protein LOC115312783, partial [Ixodes scapularis]|uniref:uncharacterized protein LOC115312783 n=1 Tax=Ixodes scapularis TaxID=6945 RepID=UPI001A9F1090